MVKPALLGRPLVCIEELVHRSRYLSNSKAFGKTLCDQLYAMDLRGFDASSFKLGVLVEDVLPTCIACMGSKEDWPWP